MLYADTELSDFVCNENERFRFHLDVLSPNHPETRARTLRFDANSVVDRPGDALFATQVSLGCLDGNVSEEELNLLQLSPSRVTQLRARATEVVRGNLVQTEHFRVVLDNVPDHSFRYVITPTLTRPADTTKQSPA